MTRNKDRKRIIRTRMKKTGESYTTARAHVIAKAKRTPKAPVTAAPPDDATLAGIKDASIAAKTGRTWSEWKRALDAENAAEMPHREIAALVKRKYGVSDWWAQMVTVGYERMRGLRERGQRRGGSYEANKSRTFGVPVEALYEAWVGDRIRQRWLDVNVAVRTATRPKSLRLQWPDGTIVAVWFMRKGAGKSTVSVSHTKLVDRQAADAAKAFWTQRLDALAAALEPA